MFREMRRKERALDICEAKDILGKCDYGVLSVIGDDGYPYGVPVNYAYVDGKIIFHSTSKTSHKIEALRANAKVCFTVVTKHELVAEEYSTNFESIIVFGKAVVIDEKSAKLDAMAKMMNVLAPEMKAAAMQHCPEDMYVMVEITPEHITGKARRHK